MMYMLALVIALAAGGVLIAVQGYIVWKYPPNPFPRPPVERSV